MSYYKFQINAATKALVNINNKNIGW